MLIFRIWGVVLPQLCWRIQVVTEVDLKSTGLCPRRFEPCRQRSLPFRLISVIYVLPSNAKIEDVCDKAPKNIENTWKKKSSPTRVWTAATGFKVQGANHYTIGEIIRILLFTQQRWKIWWLLGTHKYPTLILWFKLIWASLAQSVERKALNLVVAGSSPAGGAFCIDTWIFLEFF